MVILNNFLTESPMLIKEEQPGSKKSLNNKGNEVDREKVLKKMEEEEAGLIERFKKYKERQGEN